PAGSVRSTVVILILREDVVSPYGERSSGRRRVRPAELKSGTSRSLSDDHIHRTTFTGSQSQDHRDEPGGLIRSKRLAGHEPAIEDGAQQGPGRQLRIDVGADLAPMLASLYELDEGLSSLRAVPVVKLAHPGIPLRPFDQGRDATGERRIHDDLGH